MSTPQYPGNKKARFERWEECDVCGVPWPASMLSRDQWGRLVCPEDIDDPSNIDFMNEDTPAPKETKPPWPE